MVLKYVVKHVFTTKDWYLVKIIILSEYPFFITKENSTKTIKGRTNDPDDEASNNKQILIFGLHDAKKVRCQN